MICAVLQARFSSSRLPGKVLRPILGKPMLELQIERVRRARTLDRIVVATSDRADDAPVAELAGRLGLDAYRGPLDDVLARFAGAVRGLDAEHVVRLTGDCPLADPDVIDLVVERHVAGGADYTSNTLERTFADGLDVEAMRLTALRTAADEATLPSDREHVTPFIYRRPERFRIEQVLCEPPMVGRHWTVDEPRDFALIEAIYEALYPADPEFGTADVVKLLEKRPELAALNRAVDRGQGWRRSLEDDRRFRDGNGRDD